MSASKVLTGIVHEIEAGVGELRTDVELLACYAQQKDEKAFQALVRRHGAFVMGIARRHLRDQALADDVFQATFLALVRSADRLHRRPSLASWLHTVARRQARKARFVADRRVARESTLRREKKPDRDPLEEITGRELLDLIDDEIDRLPEAYRDPLLLCCVEGHSREEAARQLGTTEGAIKGKLERARKRLADRLAKRGVSLTGAMLASVSAAQVSHRLVSKTLSLSRTPWAKSIPASINDLLAVASPKLLSWALMLCTLLAIGVGVYAAAPRPKSSPQSPTAPLGAKPALDNNVVKSDPLPPRATLQLGTSRYRHGTSISRMTVSRDGRLAVATSGNHYLGAVRAFDLSTGKMTFKLDRNFGFVEAVALSPDGKTVAAKLENEIHLLEAKSGKALRKMSLPNANPRTITRWLTFSPDGKFLTATSKGNEIHLLDVDKGKVIRSFSHTSAIYAAAFSPDGKLLAAGGYDSAGGDYFIRLWEVATGSELRRFSKGAGGVRSVAFSPNGKTLAGGGDDGQLRIWDVASGDLRQKFPKNGRRIRSVVISPNGQTVASCGDSIQLINLSTGREQARIDRRAENAHFSPDSKMLTAAVGGAIHQWDIATGRQRTPKGSESAINDVLATPDGATVITFDESGLAHLWNGRTGKYSRRVQGEWQQGLALSPDGRILAIPMSDPELQYQDPANPRIRRQGSRIRLYDLKTARLVERFPSFKGGVHRLAFAPGGRSLISVDHRDGAVRLWDVKSGKMQQSFRAVRKGEENKSYLLRNAILSPDGKTLAVSYDRFDNTTAFFAPVVVRLWDVATGKEKHELAGHVNGVAGMSFSPDGSLLVSCNENPYSSNRKSLPVSDRVFVWDVRTGARIKHKPDRLGIGASHVAFSPDGRALVTASADGLMRLWEVATWSVRMEFKGHRDRVSALRFAADGRLFSGSLDTTVLAWDLRPPKGNADVTLDQAWKDLAIPKAKEAFHAQGRLLMDSTASLKYLAHQIKPVKTVGQERIRQLIAELASDQFKTRQLASRELKKMGTAAELALRNAIETSKSAEVRQRAKLLLDGLENSVTPPEELQALRVIETLEWMTDPKATQLLDKLSKGDPSSRLTQAARHALERKNQSGR